VSDLSDAVLPLIRTRADVWRWTPIGPDSRCSTGEFEAIIRTHARDRSMAARLQDTAEARAEIGELGRVNRSGRGLPASFELP
jgi:hypothetical protein